MVAAGPVCCRVVRRVFGVDGARGESHARPVMVVLNALVPTFLIIALGAWMQRSGFVTASFLREANRITYWLGLPALLFSQLVASLHDAAGAESLLAAMALSTGAMVVPASSPSPFISTAIV